MKIVPLLWKNSETPKRVVDFPRERDTFRNKIMDIVKDPDEKSYNNNGNPWKSSRILRVKPNFFIFFLFSSFLLIFSFFHEKFFIFIFFMFSFFCHFFIFLRFSLFSIMFFLFLFFVCFSFFLFLFPFVEDSKSDFFFGPQFRYDFSQHFKKKKSIFRPVSVCTPLKPLFFFPFLFLLFLFLYLFLGSCSSFLFFFF